MELSNIIADEIKGKGPISFHDFMEMCLYYPQQGYYTSEHPTIGVEGDFYTSAEVSELVGAMIGRQLEQMWLITGQESFSIVEYGAGTGRLCNDILNYLKSNNPSFYSRLRYYIIEKSPVMREKERILLHEKVTWLDSIREISPVTGCVLSNELVDNFSVHRVLMQDELMEIYVDYNDKFVELLRPADVRLKEYLCDLNINLPNGFRTEINLEATGWIQEIGDCLEKGFVITIDYGYLAEELCRDRRNGGSLMCYYKHSMNDQPFCNIGEQDITSRVNFSALSHWGRRNGLGTVGYINQAGFFMSLGWEDYLNNVLNKKSDSYLAFRSMHFLNIFFSWTLGKNLRSSFSKKDCQKYS